jgi:LuxR family maltose regulon positive regulatory protein
LDLAQDNIAQAERWATEYRLARVAHAVAYLREFEDLTLARVLLWGQKSDDALDILRPLAAAARDGGRNRTVIEAHVLQAIAQSERDDRAADASLTTAISLAAPEGFARLFLDEGPALAPLLARVRHTAPEFVDQLLTAPAAGEPASADSRPDALTTRSSPQLEPLSGRELEVLRLLAAGLSNQEIAGELVISVGTAKWHAHNIFAKLGVRGRTQAIARAREWRLI